MEIKNNPIYKSIVKKLGYDPIHAPLEDQDREWFEDDRDTENPFVVLNREELDFVFNERLKYVKAQRALESK